MTPSSAERHRAMSSLRRNATIMIFLIRPPAFPIRSRNPADKVLPGCPRGHGQARSSMPPAPRLLPFLPIPCLRAAAGEWPTGARRLAIGRAGTNSSHVHKRADRAFRGGGRRRPFSAAARACSTSLIRRGTSSSRSRRRSMRTRPTCGIGPPSGCRDKASCSRRPPASPAIRYARRRQKAADLVHDRTPCADQILAFARRPPSRFAGFVRDRNHRTNPRFAAPRGHRGATSISASIPSVFARRARRSTRRLDDCLPGAPPPRRARTRASENPSRPAAWVKISRAIGWPGPRGAASLSIPWLERSRSTCLIAGLAGRPRARARPWPAGSAARRSALADAEGGVGQGRACHAGRRRKGRQGRGGVPKSRGFGCVSSSGPANHGCMGKIRGLPVRGNQSLTRAECEARQARLDLL